METAPLKSFATSARTELIREVGARITAVLAQGAPERVEQPKAVTALERAIAGAGGGDKGKAHVADKVAYTWFNRIIALRFMDANGYTGIGVVSPSTDQVGQPEVLAAAKRGQLDTDVVKGTSSATVTGLLNGTRQPRRGVDAQAEAYALLLADYCRFWNTAMPFMFEREGDYTELLIPANLLAEDSVLSRSVTVLTEEVCQDVEVIGWLYQFYISERKDEVFAGFKKNEKAGADEIPAATQLFTPHWIVRYLVENSLGRLWMLNRPSSGLASQMDYYIAPVDEETDFLKISKPEELKVIDPACGSGHMLTYAFDLLYAIYEEEGYAPSEIPNLVLANNLYGTEIDQRAGALAAFALTMKAAAKRKLFLRNPVEPNVCVLGPIPFSADELSYLVSRDGDRHAEEAFWNQFAEADTFGSLIQPDQSLVGCMARRLETLGEGDDIFAADTIEWAWQVIRQAKYLTPRYSVVVANPPYMGARNMAPGLAAALAVDYPAAKQNAYGAFVLRCLSLAGEGGEVAMIVGDEWMTASTYEAFREVVLNAGGFSSLLHLRDTAYHPDTFGANVAFAMNRSGNKDTTTVCVRLEPLGDAAKESVLRDAIRDARSSYRYEVKAADIAHIAGRPFAYAAVPEALAAFRNLPPLASEVALKAGISTGDNTIFEREWHEVSRDAISPLGTVDYIGSRRWTPCSRGAPFRRWYGHQSTIMDWERDGERIRAHRSSAVRNPGFQGRSGLTFTKIGSGKFSVRALPAGFVFDDTGRMMFPADGMEIEVLGLVNSSTVQYFLDLMCPGTAFTSTEIGRIPLAPLARERVGGLVARAIRLSRSDWESLETAVDFRGSPLLDGPDQTHRLAVNVAGFEERCRARAEELASVETQVNTIVALAYGMSDAVSTAVDASDVSLEFNPAVAAEANTSFARGACVDLVSYAIGCMFGRYSLDEPGLILADQGATLHDYLAKVPTATFMPDADNVIPIVDGDWFEDDLVGLFRGFLRTTFGDQHFEENLKFVTSSLGVKNLRDYFITRAGKSKFYEDHVQRYKKRPIYWLFSSPEGSFNALVYMHRYMPSTVSTVLTYLREYVTKLESALQQAERAGNAKEADRLRKILVELTEYEHDTLYPKASENVVIDLDDGVRANYPKFGAALRKITGLETSGD